MSIFYTDDITVREPSYLPNYRLAQCGYYSHPNFSDATLSQFCCVRTARCLRQCPVCGNLLKKNVEYTCKWTIDVKQSFLAGRVLRW
ncbi:unnamed protein product [Colias eurytheme]|nr:unnamed protein product [Colias eurytheme]